MSWLTSQSQVEINRDKLEQLKSFLALRPANPQCKASLPLKFDSVRQQVNLLCVLHAVNFGSSWEPDIQDGILWLALRGAMGFHLTSKSLGADFLCQISISEIESLFGIQSTEEVPISAGSPIRMSQPSKHSKLVKALVHVLQDVGRVLRSFAAEDFFELIVQECREESRPPETERLISRFVQMAAFNDQYEVEIGSEKQTFWILSKLHKLIHSLAHEVGPRDSRFQFDLSQLSISIDCSVPLALRSLGVLEIAPDLQQRIDVEKKEIQKDSECLIRTASMAICADVIGSVLTLSPQKLQWFLYEHVNSTAFEKNVMPIISYGSLHF